MDNRRQKSRFLHVVNAEHTRKAQGVIFFVFFNP
jgi:hypothetical protein